MSDVEDVGAGGNTDSQELRDRIDNSGGVVRHGQGVCCWKKVEI